MAYKARKTEDRFEGGDQGQILIPPLSKTLQDSSLEDDFSPQEIGFEVTQSPILSEDLDDLPIESPLPQENITRLEDSPVNTSEPPKDTVIGVEAEPVVVSETVSSSIEEVKQLSTLEQAHIPERSPEEDERSSSYTLASNSKSKSEDPKIIYKDGKILLNLRSKNRGKSTSDQQVPMMFRAQASERCSLQFASNKQDLGKWTEEFLTLHDRTPNYQPYNPQLGQCGEVYRCKVKFPFRLFSNSGQDSILRPTLGRHGIPYLPGSSIKGVFRRACQEQADLFCGDPKKLKPGILRFHGAYPVGNWTERISDVCHSQQNRQVGIGKYAQRTNAIALLSLYQPEMIFEFSSKDPNIEWDRVKQILVKALELGIGGKTSSGYGLGGQLEDERLDTRNYQIHLKLKKPSVKKL
jgi:CRISPR/Cas system CMR subunit Cmr6 (Cas7 group RAMP superfamily)